MLLDKSERLKFAKHQRRRRCRADWHSPADGTFACSVKRKASGQHGAATSTPPAFSLQTRLEPRFPPRTELINNQAAAVVLLHF